MRAHGKEIEAGTLPKDSFDAALMAEFNEVVIESGVTITPATVLNLTGISMATMTLTGELICTLSNVPAGPVLLRVVHDDNPLSIEGKTDWIDNGLGEYEIRIIKYDTGVVRVSDVNGGQGDSIPSSLGAFSATGITLSSSGYYNAATIAANTTLSFATSGHEEGKKRYVKLTFDGTDTLSVGITSGVTVNIIGFQSVTPITAGTYMLYMTVEGGEITVELKTIADVLSQIDFGETTILASIASATGQHKGMQFTVPSSGNIQSISIYHRGDIAGNMTLGVYSNSANLPVTKLRETASTALTQAGWAWQTFNLSSPLAVNANDVIWLCWVNSVTVGFRYQNGKGFLRFTGTATGQTTLPTTMGAGTTADTSYSIYATIG